MSERALRFVGAAGACEDSTLVAIADGSGRILASAGCAVPDPPGKARDLRRQQAVVVEKLAAARTMAGLAATRPLDALVVGIEGYAAGVTPAPAFDQMATRIAVVPYAEIAHTGALGGVPGIVVIAGREGIALGTAPGSTEFARAGGWGALGLDGGACWIGHEAVRSAMAAFDRGEVSRLSDAALTFFDVPTLRALVGAHARGEIPPARMAAFAPIVLELATRVDDFPGAMDREAYYVRTHAAHLLVELAMTVERRLPACAQRRRFSFAGELFADDGLREKFSDMLVCRRSAAEQSANVDDEALALEHARVSRALAPSRVAPHLRPTAPVSDAFGGAIVLARALLGGGVSNMLFTSRDVLALLERTLSIE